MADRTIVRLKILSKVHTPEWISTAIGVQCDQSWHVGDNRGKSRIKADYHGFLISSGAAAETSVKDHAVALLRKLEHAAPAIHALSDTDTVEFSCVIYCESPPALSFPQGLIAEISALGASFDIDLYVLGETNPSR